MKFRVTLRCHGCAHLYLNVSWSQVTCTLVAEVFQVPLGRILALFSVWCWQCVKADGNGLSQNAVIIRVQGRILLWNASPSPWQYKVIGPNVTLAIVLWLPSVILALWEPLNCISGDCRLYWMCSTGAPNGRLVECFCGSTDKEYWGK